MTSTHITPPRFVPGRTLVGARLLLALTLALACGGGGRTGPADAGDPPPELIRFDGAMVDDDPLDASAGTDARTMPDLATTECGDSRPARTNSAGILTSFPEITWSYVPSTLVPTTASFVITEDDDSRGVLLEMWGEIRNDGALECNMIPEVTFDGREIVTLVETPAYRDEFSNVTDECLGRGDTGVFRGVARGITLEDLEAGGFLFFDADPSTFSEPVRAVEPPILSQRVEAVEGGYALVGTLVPSTTIYNYGLTVFPLDDRGLIVDELLDFPNRLETLPAGSSWAIETAATACPFDEYLMFQSWIYGASSGLRWDGSSEREARRLRLRERRLEIDRIRQPL